MQVATVIATFFVVLVGLLQLRAGQKALKVQRVIDLHRDLTAGEVGGARSRFTTLMWKYGERQAGQNSCHAPNWREIRPVVLGESETSRASRAPEAGAQGPGLLSVYPVKDRIQGAEGAEPMRDLYAVLWCFERIEAGRDGGALDEEMLKMLIAPHAVWWNEVTAHLTEDDTRHLGSLRNLSKHVATGELRSWAQRDFHPKTNKGSADGVT